MKISVIMQSFLGDYPGSRSNPVYKFHRAIESFLMQDYEDKELIIVSDDCSITLEEYQKEWSQCSSIKSIEGIGTPGRWDGNLRNLGIEAAEGEWITYLDSDDIIIPSRLTNLYNFTQMYPDANTIFVDGKELYPIEADPTKKVSGSVKVLDKEYKYIEANIIREFPGNKEAGVRFYTARISHRKDVKSEWPVRGKRGEDGEFSRMLIKEGNYYTVDDPSYLICHSIGLYDV